MNFLMLIPGLFAILEKFVGPMIAGHASSIASKIMGLGSSIDSSSILGVLESTMGQIESVQKLEIKAELDTLLAQCAIQQVAESNPSFFRSGCRDTLEWGLSIVVLIHLIIVEAANIHALISGGVLSPLDTLTTTLLMGLLGLYGAAKTIEKFNSNNSDN